MRHFARLLLVATLLLGCVGCDQLSKQYARAHLKSANAASFLGDTVRIVYAENSGAFLGLGSSLPEQTRVVVFQGIVGMLVLGLLWGAAFAHGLHRTQIIAAALLAASGMGNLIDRLTQEGRVTDFINVGIGIVRTGIFNLADVVGIIGVAVLVLVKSADTPPNKSLERTRDG